MIDFIIPFHEGQGTVPCPANTYGGYDVDILIRDTGSSQYLYEVKFIKKSFQQSMEDKTSSPAAKADVGNQKDATTPSPKSQGPNASGIKSSTKLNDDYMVSNENGGGIENYTETVKLGANNSEFKATPRTA